MPSIPFAIQKLPFLRRRWRFALLFALRRPHKVAFGAASQFRRLSILIIAETANRKTVALGGVVVPAHVGGIVFESIEISPSSTPDVGDAAEIVVITAVAVAVVSSW